ncbi:hypothetical protein IW262DRAFT_1490166 [Armillaria fumosa]|nr:hypothetical protein IW262DRAFT_1490166 [Armillaria fumosa]
MVTGANIPSLSDNDKVLVFETLEVFLNQIVLFAFLQGGISDIHRHGRLHFVKDLRGVGINAMALVVVVLCILTAINLAFYWLFTVHSFIHHGQSYLTVIMAFNGPSDMEMLVRVSTGISACISTVVADSAMVWRCWVVWGRRWIIIFLPLVFMVIGAGMLDLPLRAWTEQRTFKVAFKILQIRTIVQGTEPTINYKTCTTIYISLTLATTLLCTLLIVYRILSIEWARTKLSGTRTYSLGAYRNVIEIVVESAALYSTVLIVYIGFTFRDEVGGEYLDPIAEFIRGVAPTLLVERVASGHSRPDDSWKGGTISSLYFGTDRRTQTSTKTSAEEDVMRSDNCVHDVEAQALADRSDVEKVNVCQRVEPGHVADEGV